MLWLLFCGALPARLVALILLLCCVAGVKSAAFEVRASNASFTFGWRTNQDSSLSLSLSVDKPDTGWIGLGVTSSSGLGESIMHGGPQGGAAVIARDTAIREYLLTGGTPAQVVPWLNQVPNARHISLCISQNCLEQTQTCLANPSCARTLRCALSANSSFITPILAEGGTFSAASLETLVRCASGRISNMDDANEIIAGGSLMRVVACGLQKCTQKLLDSMPVSTLSASSITRNATITTITVTLPTRKLASISFASSSRVTFLFAAGRVVDGNLVAHGPPNRAFATVDLDTGELTQFPIVGVLLVHIILASVGVGFLIPLAVIARAFDRSMMFWSMLLLGMSLTFACTGALAYVNGSRDTNDSHVGVGFALLLALAMLLMVLLVVDTGCASSDSAGFSKWLAIGAQILALGLIPPCFFTGYSAMVSSAVAAPSELNVASVMSVCTSFVAITMLMHRSMLRRSHSSSLTEPSSSNRELLSSGAAIGKDIEMAVLASAAGMRDEGVDSNEEKITPMVLSWQNVTISAPKSRTQDEQKVIVMKALGFASPRTMTALMGPSGSGKTTLLETLALRRPAPTGEAKVDMNGEDARIFPNVRRMIAFLPQHDHLHEHMTTRETLVFAARLILVAKPKEEAIARALELAHRLDLSECLDTRIGGSSSTKGLSGGERKRVSIALQMLKNPSCLFLDEPTSGLDSQMALKTVLLLRSLANEGRTILASIHQPSKACFELFDRLVLLSQGATVFSGPRPDMLTFWEGIGLAIPAKTNPSEWLLEVVDVDSRETERPVRPKTRVVSERTAILDASGTRVAASQVERALKEFYEQVNPQRLQDEPGAVTSLVEYACKYGIPALDRQLVTAYKVSLTPMLISRATSPDIRRVARLASKFASSKWAEQLNFEISCGKELAHGLQSQFGSSPDLASKSETSSYGTQAGLLFERAFLLLWRNPQALRVQLASMVVFGLLIGALYSEVQFLETGPFLKTVTMAIIVAGVGFVTVSAGVQLAFDDRLIFERELGDAIYSPFPYFLHKALVNIPVAFAISLGMIIPAYFWVGLNSSREAFFFFVLANALTVTAFDAMVYAIALSVNSLDTAYVLAVFFEGIGMFFSGVSIPAYAMPDYLRWIHYIGPFSYSFGAVVVNQFERTEDEFYIDITGVVIKNKWINLGILFAFGILYRALAWHAIKRMQRRLALGVKPSDT